MLVELLQLHLEVKLARLVIVHVFEVVLIPHLAVVAAVVLQHVTHGFNSFHLDTRKRDKVSQRSDITAGHHLHPPRQVSG